MTLRITCLLRLETGAMVMRERNTTLMGNPGETRYNNSHRQEVFHGTPADTSAGALLV